MKWVPLQLSKTAEMERQVDEVCKTLDMLCRQKETASNAAQVMKAREVLAQSMVERIKALEQFYLANDLDARASKIEQCRIKLKRGLAKVGMSAAVQNGIEGAHHAATASPVTRQPPTPNPNSAGYSSLLNPSTFGGDGAAITSSPSSGFPYGTPPSAEPSSLPASLDTTAEDASGPQVLLRVVMTQEDFEELKIRRAAISKFLRGGAANGDTRRGGH